MVFALTVSLLLSLFGAPSMSNILTLYFSFSFFSIAFNYFLLTYLSTPLFPNSLRFVCFLSRLNSLLLSSNYGSLPHFYSLVVFVWSVFLYLVQLLCFYYVGILLPRAILFPFRYFVFWFIYLYWKSQVKLGDLLTSSCSKLLVSMCQLLQIPGQIITHSLLGTQPANLKSSEVDFQHL